METNDTVSSKEAAKHKHKDTTKSDYLENNIIPEDRSKEMYNGKMFNLLVSFLKKYVLNLLSS